MSEIAIHSKSERFIHSLIFGEQPWTICSRLLIPSERPEQIAHGRSFVLSDLSNSLTFCFFKLFKNCEDIQKNCFFSSNFFERIACFLWAKEGKQFSQKKSDLLICSFIMSNLSYLLTFAHFSWATWSICSLWLICPEWPVRTAQICSFVSSDLSKGANEQWANEQIPNPV